MTTRLTWLGALALAVLNVLTAQAQQPLPHPVPAPVPTGSHSGIEAVGDLVRAADHLEAAGAAELAAQVRQQARLVLEREAQRLAHEQAMLQQLAQSLPETLYMIQALIAKACVTPDQLDETVHEVAGEDVLHHEQGEVVWTLSSNHSANLLRALSANDELKLEILSRPQIVTTDGRSASVMVGNPIALVAGVEEPTRAAPPPLVLDPSINGLTVGEQFPETPFAGISLILTPTSVGENRIRIEAILEDSIVSSTVPTTDFQTGDTSPSPVIDITRAQSVVEVQRGGMFIMAIPSQVTSNCTAESGTSQLLLIVTPQLMPR